ncbi:MAG: DUF4124 domain-containing protein [Chromatiales bacterium]|nr:DUF4124 domain-containing protein [Chromatiales bacterium]
MKYLILFLSLWVVSPAYAGIYKWVDEQGNIHFSDQPTPGASEVELSEPTIYSPSEVERRRNTFERELDEAAEEAEVPYRSLRINKPKNDGTVRSNNGEVSASFSVTPRLQRGHKFRVYLDDSEVASGLKTGRIKLKNVYRGTHTLYVTVVDGNGVEKIRSDEIIFYVQAVSKIFRDRRNNSGDDSNGDGSDNGDSNDDGSDGDGSDGDGSDGDGSDGDGSDGDGTDADDSPSQPAPQGPFDPNFEPGGSFTPSNTAPNFTPSFTPNFTPSN